MSVLGLGLGYGACRLVQEEVKEGGGQTGRGPRAVPRSGHSGQNVLEFRAQPSREFSR